jgi:uncharacterized protein HemX
MTATDGGHVRNAGAVPDPVSPYERPMWRPSFPWVSVMLVSLVLVIVIGGLSVGDFYWNDLRPDMGRIGSNLAQVRDRQRVMMGNFAEAQALLLEQQRRLVAQAQDLRRREQAVYEARIEINAQRAQLSQDLQAEAERRQKAARDGEHAEGLGAVSGSAAARLLEAADLAKTAAEVLSQDDDLEPPRSALALAAAVLMNLPSPAGDPGRAALADAQSRLADIRPVDRTALAQRLKAVQERAINLRPVVARLLRPTAGERTERKGRLADPVRQAAQSLNDQFEAARLALDVADSASFGGAMQGIQRWLSAFYEPRLPDTAAVLAELRALAETPVVAQVAPLSEALAALAEVLRDSAARTGGL